MRDESIRRQPATAPKRGRPAEWSREQITAAAVTVADSDGLAAVTMRRVAAEMGTASASLYRHVATRDELIDLMVNDAFETYETAPATGQWRADLVAEQLHQLRYLRSRPWLLDAVLTRPPIGAAVLRLFEHCLGLLASHPASGAAKMEAIGVLTGMVQNYARHERPAGGVLDKDFVAAQMAALMRAAGDGTHPHLAAALSGPTSGVGATADERFVRILGRVLDGLLSDP